MEWQTLKAKLLSNNGNFSCHVTLRVDNQDYYGCASGYLRTDNKSAASSEEAFNLALDSLIDLIRDRAKNSYLIYYEKKNLERAIREITEQIQKREITC